MFKDYYQVRDWLENFIPLVYGKEELGLARIENLLAKLGNTENKFKSIHVAGTSGKGSTAFYISRMLQLSVFGCQLSDISQPVGQYASFKTEKPKTGKLNSENRKQKTDNWKIGLHISPHLVDIRERMQIFQFPISNEQNLMPMKRFLKLFNEIKPVVEKIQRGKPELTPSYFEILVAASFLYFAQEKVDWAVVEVGLGGRFDATNVLIPEVSVITNVGLDHTEILGKTIEKIAYEKAGIIKNKVTKVTKEPNEPEGEISNFKSIGVPVVTGATGKALGVIKKVAKEKGSDVYEISTQDYKNKLLEQLNPAQVKNAVLALKAVEVLSLSDNVIPAKAGIYSGKNWILGPFDSTQGKRVENDRINSIFSQSFLGRFEEVDKEVVLDGAHNPDKIRALLEFIGKSKVKSQKSKVGGVILVIGFKKGKQWKKMVDLLIKNLPIKQVIATKFHAVTDTGRFAAVEPREIASYLNVKCQMSNVKCFDNSHEAVFEALDRNVILSDSEGSKDSSSSTQNDKKSVVLVTGSLYLVGEARTIWYLPEF